MKFIKKIGFYESEPIEYEIRNENHSIVVELIYKVFPIIEANDGFLFKYSVIEKNYGGQTNRVIPCEKEIDIKQMIEMIINDIAGNPELLTSFIGLT